MDKISVIVPVYNCEEYIGRCIDSILAQTYESIELILLDDGSSDNSLSVCHSYEDRDDRIKIFHSDNRGVFLTRIDGVRKASGDYIAFIDCDDFVSFDYLEYLYKLLTDNKADIASCGYYVTENSDITTDNTPEIFKQFDYNSAIKSMNTENLWSVCFKLYKKSLFTDEILSLNCGLSVSEDYLFNCFIFRGVDKIILSNIRKYFYFRHGGAVMQSEINPQRIEDSMRAYQLVLDDMQEFSSAYAYQAANKLDLDFLLINRIITEDKCTDYFETIKNDIRELKRFAFDKRNSDLMTLKKRAGLMLLLYSPSLYVKLIKLRGH
jgi:glycosyltransferase involved in cell wall biosynthesis